MNKLSEDRMKELSANDMDVWVFDTKRNSNVQRGRQEQEMLNKRRQESIVDLEMDFLAPYLQKFPDINSLTKAQAMEVISNILLYTHFSTGDLFGLLNIFEMR